jgi:DNA-binding SARP family transcriptional activator
VDRGADVETQRQVTVLGSLGLRPSERMTGIGRCVVAHLALQGRRQMRSLVYSDLWPDVPEARARANLRRALWQLPRGWVRVEGPDLVLDAGVDLQEARRVARRTVRDGVLTWEDMALLDRDVLPGWSDDWVVDEQESFHLLRTQALEAACRRATSQRDYTLATQAGLLAVQSEPLRESAVEALVEAALREGNRQLALHHYRAFADTLSRELRVVPDQRLQVLVSGLLGT